MTIKQCLGLCVEGDFFSPNSRLIEAFLFYIKGDVKVNLGDF